MLSCIMPQYVRNHHTMQKCHTTLAHYAQKQHENKSILFHELKNFYNNVGYIYTVISILKKNLLQYVWCELQCSWCVMVDANYERLLSFSLWNKSDEITSLLLILVLLNAVPSKQLLWSSLSVKCHSPHSSVNQFLLLIIDGNKRTSLCLWPWFPPLF